MKITRVATISKVFLEEGLGFLLEPKPEEPPADGAKAPAKEGAAPPSNAELAKRLRRTLERLGPTFVKFGQMLATRVDLFGEEIIAELAELHSRVAPFPTEEARAIVEKELGAKIDEIFSDFPDEPVAAASIAQVYKAKLQGGDGRWVAVKVQRPGLDRTLVEDLDVLVDVSGFIDALVPPYRRTMVHQVAQEYAARAKGELDFLAEASAIEQFSDVLTTLPEFRAPELHRTFCTPRVLVMEWFEGTKLDAVPTKEALAALDFDPEAFGRSMLRLQISMSYEHGFVHGDTHPGNIILLPSGHIGLIDFGLHGHVPRALREKMLETIFYQAAGRTDEAVSAFLSVLSPDASVDRESLEKELHEVLQARPKSSVRENRITEQLVKGLRVGARYRLRAQSDLFVVLRNLTIVEGIVLRYAPELDPVEEVKLITGGILRRKIFGASMREEMTQLLPQLLLNISKRPQLAERLLKLERSFTDSKDLGEFLRKERVIVAPPAARGYGAMVLVVVAAVALAAGWALHATLR
jgi:ubiquinone biosynthesis protein